MTDLAWMSIADLAENIRTKQISPVEAVQACLDRVERLNDGLRAFISVYPDLALADARAAEAAVMAGDDLGPLQGVPLAIKDLFAVRGMARTCGSRLIAEGPGTADAESVAALRAAGGIVVGLANLHEFAFGPTGINPHFGTAKNPWDRSKVCGGSSSGSGCAVAAGLVPGAMGTDTGGSVRIPAALCGIVGLKPTHLRVSQQGIYPLAGEFDTGGPMTRSVADTALMMQALDPEGGFAGHRARPSLEGIRIGVAETLFNSAVDPDIGRHCRAAIAVLEALGAETERLDLPFADDAVAAWTTISLGRVYALHGARAEAADSKLSPSVRERVLTGRDISSADVDKALDDPAGSAGAGIEPHAAVRRLRPADDADSGGRRHRRAGHPGRRPGGRYGGARAVGPHGVLHRPAGGLGSQRPDIRRIAGRAATDRRLERRRETARNRGLL